MTTARARRDQQLIEFLARDIYVAQMATVSSLTNSDEHDGACQRRAARSFRAAREFEAARRRDRRQASALAKTKTATRKQPARKGKR